MTSSFKKSTSQRSQGAKLGQHFLTSHSIAKTIAKESGAKKGMTILEVGPGKGMLTRELLILNAKVVAIEKDPEMVEILNEEFVDEIKNERLVVVKGDARDFLTKDFGQLKLPKSYSVAANIPYYITGELIRLFLTAEHQPKKIALLIQKEVADRIARSKKESILSLSVKVYGAPKYIKTVKAGSFNPPPKVDSAVLSIDDISQKNFTKISPEAFFEVLHTGFGQKRKTLSGNLRKKYGNEHVALVWESLKLDPKARAEDISLNTWLEITKRIQT